jgi:chromosome segregation ATPase
MKGLKKDISTYERMAKQAEENSKNKDAQLKRAADTIARLKLQLQEAQQQVQVRNDLKHLL